MWIWQLTSCIVWGQLQQLRKEAQRFQARVEGSPGTGNTCHPAKCQQTWNHTSILWQIKLPTHYLRKCFCNAMWNRDPEGICSATPGDGLSVFHCFSTCKVAEVMKPWDQQASYVLRKYHILIYIYIHIDIPIDPYKYCIFHFNWFHYISIIVYIHTYIYTYVYIYIYIYIFVIYIYIWDQHPETLLGQCKSCFLRFQVSEMGSTLKAQVRHVKHGNLGGLKL